jgi:hypothetical protein
MLNYAAQAQRDGHQARSNDRKRPHSLSHSCRSLWIRLGKVRCELIRRTPRHGMARYGEDADEGQYAVEHRLPVMTPEWIEDMHRRWIHAEEVDVRQVRRHTFWTREGTEWADDWEACAGVQAPGICGSQDRHVRYRAE